MSWRHVLGMRLRVLDTGEPSGLSHGADALPLLVIPGHTARIDGYLEMIGRLALHRRVIAVDLPGCGDADRPDRPYDLRFYEDTLLALVGDLGIEQAIPVGGSLGGNLVLRLGARAPEVFPTLVVWAPGGAWTARPRLGGLVKRLGRRTFWPSVWIQSRFWYDRDFPGRQQSLDETFAYYRRNFSPGFVRMYWGMAGDQIAHSLFDIASEVSQRTLLMWGDRDNGAGMGAGVATLRELLPDCEFVVFEGARHSIETEIPHELAATISRFLGDVTH